MHRPSGDDIARNGLTSRRGQLGGLKQLIQVSYCSRRNGFAGNTRHLQEALDGLKECEHSEHWITLA